MPISSRSLVSALLLGCSVLAGPAWAQDSTARPPSVAPYRDARRSPADRAQDLLVRMTLEEKFWQLFMIPGDRDNPAHDYRAGSFGLQVNVPAGMRAEGLRTDTIAAGTVARAHAERINALQRWFVNDTRLGIPLLPFEETLHGLGREGATTFPQAIALAATWDTTMMHRVATAIAAETRSRGIRMSLSPVINIANDVRWGRVEETYGEDVWLTSAMARAYITPFERAGIITTPKHFIANVGDGGRDSYPIEFSERLLQERYFPPFESAIRDAKARSVMSAYNSVDGTPATQNRALLTDVLRRGWGFEGIVISDAAATGGATVLHHTEASTATATRHALESGLDVIFQSTYEQHRPYLAAFRSAGIAPAVIDSAVARVLRVKFAMGLFESPYVNADSAALVARSDAHRALAREAAASSIVLLRNDSVVAARSARNARVLLPLSATFRRIAVIGEDATEARVGGYSPPGARAVSVLEGIRAGAPSGTVVRASAGVPRVWRRYGVIPATAFSSMRDGKRAPGLDASYWNNITMDGTPTITRVDAQVEFGWTLNSPGRGLPFDWYSARWVGSLTVPPSGVQTIAVEGNDGYRLYIDGVLRIDNWRKQSFGVRNVRVQMMPGSVHDIRLEYFETTGSARLKLLWDAGVRDTQEAAIASAVSLARTSDVAIIVAGIEEGEFRDRALLGLPGRQEELIKRVAATGTPVVVALVGGSAITMPWLTRVNAVLDVWYPGQEGGHAVADVLFGKVNPAGRLPLTFPMHEGQVPLYYAHKPTGRGDDYLDLTGQPLFPFGHGLSYTTFAYSGLRVEVREPNDRIALVVRATVRNSGARAGEEVVQLYLHDVLASVARPVRELAGFARVALAAGEAREVEFRVVQHQLSMLDADMKRVVEPGVWRVMVGGSSREIRLRGEVTTR